MENTENTVQSIREIRKPTHKKVTKWLWALTILGTLAIAGIFVLLSFQDLPSFEELENPKSNLASEVYAANGQVLGRYYIENRVPVRYEELSPNLVKALVATEDERYYNHSGIDGEALGRVLGKTVLLRNKNAGGASTITQQLAKMLFTDQPGSGLERVVQKLKEWIIAVKLERSYTKEEIMAMYLNKFNFIYGAYGIKAASETYFGKSHDSLRVEEAASMVGMLKNPSLYNPKKFPKKAFQRRMVVLKQMQKNDLLTQAQYDSLKVLPMDMTGFARKTHADGLAPYFRMELRKELKRILAAKENRKPDGEAYDIYKDGLRIYTTLDPTIQEHAEAAMLEHMKKLQARFFRKWRGKDPWTYKDSEMEPEEQEAELLSKTNSLKRIVRSTDRYAMLRKSFIGELSAEIKEKFEYELRDTDIERILAEEKGKGVIARLVANKMIQTPRAVKYRKIMKSDQWTKFKSQWSKLQARVQEVFSEPVKMRVFTYDNEAMEKDTVLSPLDSIKYHRMHLQIGSMSVDPKTGHVKAWVGGVNHKFFQYDHVTSERQVGSTFKPFIYATAIAQQGISPCFVVDDLPYTIHKGEGNFTLLEDWTPNNANGEYSGEKFTLFKGLQWSKNTVSTFLMKQLGDTEPVRELVNNMGLDKNKKRSNGTYRVPKQPSICLGATDLTVQELTGAYTTFANNGVYSKPIFILRIEDKNGQIIYEELPEERQALHPNPNYVVLTMLKNVMNQGLPGFGSIKSEVGGKTGTTNDYVDGWFMGITPDLVTGTWVGGDDRWIRFVSLSDGIGAKMARPFFAKLLQKIERDPEVDYDKKARFNVPPGDLGIVVDCEEYGSIFSEGDALKPQENENFGDEPWGDEEEPDSTKIPAGPEEEDEEFGEEF